MRASRRPLRIAASLALLAALALGCVARSREGPTEARSALQESTSYRFPLRVSANGRYFVDQDARPFFWLGDTSWLYPIAYTDADADLYLDNRLQHGFTVIQIVSTYPHDRNTEGQSPFYDQDPTRPNAAYFDRLVHLVRKATTRGLVVAMGTFWENVVYDGLVNSSNARAFGQYLGSRFRDEPNLVWMVGMDIEPAGHEATFRELAAGLREGTAHQHLLTFHPRAVGSSSRFWPGEPWLDFHMVQTWHDYHNIYRHLAQEDWLLVPPKPSGLGEGAYEDGDYPSGHITPHLVRWQAYTSYLAGAYHTYGQVAVMIAAQREPAPWPTQLDRPGTAQLRHVRDFFTALAWWTLEPDTANMLLPRYPDEHLANGGRMVGARTSDGSLAVVYVPTPRTFTVDLSQLHGPVTARWFDPTDGTYTTLGRFASGALQQFTPPVPKNPGDPDVVLLLQVDPP